MAALAAGEARGALQGIGDARAATPPLLVQRLAQRQVRIHRQHIACCQIMQTKWNHGIGQNRLSLLKSQVNPDSIPVPANLRAIVAAQC